MREDLKPQNLATAEARVIEEIGEVLQAYGKLKRFGPNPTDYLTQKTYDNVADFNRELDDLFLAIALFKKYQDAA